MTAISANASSPYSAIAALLSNAATANNPASAATKPATPESSAAKDPTDILDLSDYAKATLARAKTEQVAADKLSAQVDAVKDPDGKGRTAKAKFSDTSGTIDLNDPIAALRDPGAYLKAQQAAHTHADGSIQSWNTTYSDVFDVNVPTTPQETNAWYKTEGPQLSQNAENFPDSFPGLADAVRNHTLTIQDGRDIPGLNLHTWQTYQGSEGGSGNAGGVNYNPKAFADPNTQFVIQGNGTVITWQKPSAQL